MKKIIVGIIICILAICVLAFCRRGTNDVSLEFNNFIRNERVEDLTLEIYCISPYTLTTIPISAEMLKQDPDTTKYVIQGEDLSRFIDTIAKEQDKFIRVDHKASYIDARMYYVLESRKNGKLVEVVMWGGDGDDWSMFFNGIEIKENKILYDVVMPFLPENVAAKWELFRDVHFD